MEAVDAFAYENIELAAKQIAITANGKIKDGEVILTYGCSSLILQVLARAKQSGRQFRVVVADGRPRYEGVEMARRLTAVGIVVHYAQVTTLPYVMPEVTKVFLGAHAVLANGSVMSRVGSSQVALIAHACHVPVLVCCETYKFSERVQTDSFVFNELGEYSNLHSVLWLTATSFVHKGDPDDLVATGRDNLTPLSDWRDLSQLTLLNLAYDVTPSSLVAAIISEVSVIPVTSVPVILRLKNMDGQAAY